MRTANKNSRFGLRLEEARLDAWRRAAKKEGLSLSAWIARNCESQLEKAATKK